jgi:hypothetical protein
MNWREALKKLGWVFKSKCSTCGGGKHTFKRGNDILVAYPSRDYYSFTEGGKKKHGRLTHLINYTNGNV